LQLKSVAGQLCEEFALWLDASQSCPMFCKIFEDGDKKQIKL
jgi:hypothetical protein